MTTFGGSTLRLALVLAFCLSMPTPTEAGKLRKPRLGPLPQNCPSAHAQIFGTWHVYGGPPVWAAGIDETGRIHVYPKAKHTRHGWGFKLGWWNEPSLTTKAVVHGWNLSTGQRMWFNQKGDTNGIPLEQKKNGLLDPGKGSIGDNGWRFHASEEFIPSAGCYVLYAQWKSGGWALPLAIGR